MSKVRNIFKSKHLREINQSYFFHMNNALTYSFLSLKASTCFFIHAFIPDAFKDNGSSNIKHIIKLLSSNNNHKNNSIKTIINHDKLEQSMRDNIKRYFGK